MTFSIPEELLPPPKMSWKKVLAGLPPGEQERILATLREDEVMALSQDWFLTARREQFPPSHSDWFLWIMMTGRGFGKNWTASNWIINEHQFGGARNSAIVAATASDLRRNCLEGPSGILSIAPEWFYPDYKPTQSKLVWPNGSESQLYTSEKPHRLRGPNHDKFWCDELSYWRYVHQAWDNLMMTVRYGTDNRGIITMTPRPIRIVKSLMEREGKDAVFSRGSTYENRDNLSGTFFEEVVKSYKGTALERQEIYGLYEEDIEGALWSRKTIDGNRRSAVPTELSRIVVGVDPSITGGDQADEAGIVVAGLDRNKEGYILADYSMKGSPNQWARKVVHAYHEHEANLVVAEKNQGGEMVREIMHNIDASMPVKLVHASRAKVARAEPVAALDEQGRIHHVGSFPAMEDEMCMFVPGDVMESPNRVDARVWAMTELMVQSRRGGTWGKRVVNRIKQVA